MAMTPHRALKAVLGLMISISVRNKLCFVVTLLAAFVAINMKAAEQWRFEPTRLDGQPIRSKASISFVYDRGLFPPTKPKK
jgi:hypothetical protein